MDVPTLFFVEASLLFLFSLTMMVNSIGQRSQESNYWFAASNFCGAVGMVLHSMLHHAPLYVTIIIPNLLLFVELTFLNKAIAEFVSHGRKIWLGFLALSTVMTAASAYIVLGRLDQGLVVDCISVITISTATCSAILLFRYAAPGIKAPTFITGTLFSLYAINNTWRMIDAFGRPDLRFYHIWFDRTIIAGLSFGYLLMSAARLRNKLEEQANTDPLTGTLNRRAIEHEAVRLVTRKHPRSHCVSALMLDLDRFKEINDNYGHDAGDRALRALADCLRKTMRTGDLVARLGGDEFLVVMGGTNAEEAGIAANRLQASLAKIRVQSDSGEFRVQASIGITSMDGSNFQLEDLMRLGDRALYAAKSRSRGDSSAIHTYAVEDLTSLLYARSPGNSFQA